MVKKNLVSTGYTCIVMLSLLVGCIAEENARKNRTIVIAMDFSKSTANTKIRNEEINFVNKLSRCFRVGDRVFLYQITNRSFKEPKNIIIIEIPFPGKFETSSQILRKYRFMFKKKLKENYKSIVSLGYEGTDISGFISYVDREFDIVNHEKILLIISDGIESTKQLSPEILIANGPEETIRQAKENKQIAILKEWNVIRTGLWEGISSRLMNIYDEYWKLYFSESQAKYQRVGFQISKMNSMICDLFGNKKHE